MIKIVNEDGRACPMMFCDVCKHKISDFKLANAIWDWDSVIPLYVHKGCDNDRGRFPLSSELGEHLFYLIRNLGMSADDLAEIEEFDEKFTQRI